MASIDTQSIRRRWPIYVLLVLAGLIVAVVGFASWLLLDTNRLRSALEESISALSDRPFHIDGEFDISLGRVTTIRGTNIRWRNPAWSEQPDMLTVRELSLSVDLWSVIKGPVVIDNAQAEDATLWFEWSQDGQLNWRLGANAEKVDDGSRPIRLLLSQTELRKVAIHVRHPELTRELLVDVEQASQQHDSDDMLLITSSVRVDDRPIDVQGRVGPFAELIAGGAIDYELDLTGKNGSLAASGHFDRLVDPIAPRLDLTAVAADAEDVLKALAMRPVTSGKVNLQARISPAADRLDGTVKGNFGEFNIDARLNARSITSFGEFSLALGSDGPSAGTLGRLAGVDNLPDKPYTLQVDASRSAQRLQVKQLSFTTDGIALEASGTAHKLPQFRDLDADVALQAGNAQTVGKLVSLSSLPALPLNIKATIKSKGGGHDDELRGQLALGNISGEISGRLTEKKDFAGSFFSLQLATTDLRELAQSRAISLPAAVPARLEAELALMPERLRISSLIANIAENRLAAAAEIDFGRGGPSFAAEPRINGSDLRSLASLLLGGEKAAYFPGGNYELTAKLAGRGSRLTITNGDGKAGDNVIGFDGSVDLAAEIPKVAGSVTASGKNLAELLRPQLIKGVPAAAFSLNASLQVSDRGVVLDELQFALGESSLSGRLSSGWPQKPEQMAFDLTAAGSDLQASLPEIPGYIAAPVAFRIEARGTADSTTIEIERLDGKLADAGVTLAGKLLFKPRLSADAVHFSAAGPKLSDLGQVRDWPLVELPFAVSATMSSSEDQLRMDDVKAKLGDSDLEGSLRLAALTRPGIDLKLRSGSLRLDQLFAYPAADASKVGQEGKSSKALSDRPLRLDALRAFDGTLAATLTRVDGEHRQLRNIVADATLKDGLLTVKQLQADAQHGKVNASFSVDSRGAQPLVKGKLQAADVVFPIRKMSPEDRDKMPRLQLDSSFSASGDSVRALAAGLDGYFWLRASKGRTPSLGLGELYGGFASLLIRTVNPFARKDPYTSLSCGGIYFAASNGLVETAPVAVIQTDKLSIVSKGTIDLRSEELQFVFKTTPLQGVGFSAGDIINPFIKLGGTLQEPVLRADVQNAAIEGGLAAATSGLSIVATSLWDRWVGSSDVCQKALEEARKIRRAKDPADPPDF